MSAATVAASGPPTTDKAQTAADPKRILVGAVTMIAVEPETIRSVCA